MLTGARLLLTLIFRCPGRPALLLWATLLSSASAFLLPAVIPSFNRALAQETLNLDGIEIPISALQVCFGVTGITERRALEICDALYLRENVRARELAQQWVASEPDSPAAHFALAEVFSRVEGNLPRALFHLKRTEELTNYTSLGRAFAGGNMEWHYLSLTQLSFVYQMMGDQHTSLEYLAKIQDIYGQDTESYRGWPLIKLKDYAAARASAERVLATSDNRRDRSRAWNTLCAVELADLRPNESLAACERAMSEDEDFALSEASSVDTVHLLNASEVSMNLLRMDEAENYLRRAVQSIDPNSVGNPWIYMLYLTMAQSRFDESRAALDNMLVWRQAQTPLVGVMNRAEHFMVSAMFLLLAGYPEDAARLSATALNQPDRTGSYSADESQKDSIAALVNKMANRTAYELWREQIATRGFFESLRLRVEALVFRFKAWRSARHAASLFADMETLQNRLRPYSPLDVHIPEWVEPELIGLMGPGVMASVLEQTRASGAFSLNEGYYFSYRTEIAWLNGQHGQTIELGLRAMELLPDRELMPRARIAARVAVAAWRLGQHELALNHYAMAMEWDPSIIRRLGVALPVSISGDGSAFAREVSGYLQKSPRLQRHANGFLLEVSSAENGQICLNQRNGAPVSCHRLQSIDEDHGDSDAQWLVRQFHHATFSLGFDIPRSQRLALLGSSVVLTGRDNPLTQQGRDTFIQR
jgi:tetratricopeptide (TPR) repeat protein